MTSKEVKSLLYSRFSAPAYAFFTEVGSSTGPAQRYIDGVAFNLFASRGFEVEGFEIKVSRQDFLNEMKNPRKSDDALGNFDRWWLVAPQGVAHPDELPKNWGFYEIRGNRLFKKKQAPFLEGNPDPGFIAACMRRASEDVVPKNILFEQRQEIYAQARKDYEERSVEDKQKIEKLEQRIKEFKEKTGVDIGCYYGLEELGKVVEYIIYNRFKEIDYDFERVVEGLRGLIKGVEKYKEITKICSQFSEIKRG